MTINLSYSNLVNVVFIAAGLGICGLSIMQIGAGMHIRKEAKKYLQLFLTLINIYISINNDQFLSVFSFQGTEKINFTIVKLTLEPCFAGFRGLDMFCFIPRLSHQPSGTRNNFTLLISHRSCDILIYK